MAKKLSTTALNKLNKELDEKKEILLCDGQYKCNVDQMFRTSKIKKLIASYQDLLEQLSNIEDLDLNVMKENTFLLYTLIIAIFTDVPVPTDNVAKIINVTETLIDTGIMEEVLKEFPSDEFKKLNYEIEKATSNFTSGVDDNGDT